MLKKIEQQKKKNAESNYHGIALLYEGKWLGDTLPLNVKDKTLWSCKLGHSPFYASYRYILTCEHLPCPDCKRPWIGQTLTKMYLERFTGLSFPSIRPDFLKYRTGSKLELDGFNEEYRVAFEYNGIGHYIKDSRQSEEDFIKLKARDEWKYKKTKENGIMLLTIKESENGVSPDDIRSIALNFILKCELPLVDNFETIFVSTAEIYLVDPRIEVAKEAKKLNLVMVSDQYISRNYKIPFECLNCKYIRNVSPMIYLQP